VFVGTYDLVKKRDFKSSIALKNMKGWAVNN